MPSAPKVKNHEKGREKILKTQDQRCKVFKSSAAKSINLYFLGLKKTLGGL